MGNGEERKKLEHTAQIEEFKTQLEELKRENDKLSENLDQNLKYLHYLETTCENTGDEFGEPLDLQHRHETLQEKYESLLQRRKDGDEEKDSREKELRKY